LMLLLAHLMTQNEIWKKARIQVNVAKSDSNQSAIETHIKTLLEDARIEADIIFISNAATAPLTNSSGAAMVFLSFRDKSLVCPFSEPDKSIDELIPSCPPVAIVLAREDIDLDAEPEEGKPAEVASAMDELDEAKETAENALKDAKQADNKALASLDKIKKAEVLDSSEKIMTDLVSDALNAKRNAEKASKRAAIKIAIAQDKDQELKKKMDES